MPSSSLSRKFSGTCSKSPFSKKPFLIDSFIIISLNFDWFGAAVILADKGQIRLHVSGALSYGSPHSLHQTFSSQVGPGLVPLSSPSSLCPVFSELLDCASKLINSLNFTHCGYEPNLDHAFIYGPSKETSRLC